jgi:hypothetical protein
MFRQTPVVTFRSSLSALRLKIWDEERGALVRLPRTTRYEGSRGPAAAIFPASSTK